jgi:hypothetical protein
MLVLLPLLSYICKRKTDDGGLTGNGQWGCIMVYLVMYVACWTWSWIRICTMILLNFWSEYIIPSLNFFFCQIQFLKQVFNLVIINELSAYVEFNCLL